MQILWCLFYFLIPNLAVCFSNEVGLSNELLILSQNVSGASKLRDEINSLNLQNLSASSGPELAKQLARNVDDKMISRGSAVNRLLRATYKAYITKKWGNITECCRFNFYMNTKTENLCTRISEYAREQNELPNIEFLEAAKLNLQQFPGLKAQYFGSETGILTQYPAQISNDCIDYDPRFRPWYVQSSTSGAKDIVLVIDRSASMLNQQKIEAAKHAGITVMNSLSPNDRVSVIVFSDTAEILGSSLANVDTRHYVSGDETFKNCFKTSMAQATPENIKRLTSALKEVKPYGETKYTQALNLSFSLLRNAFEQDVSKKCGNSGSSINATAVAYSRHRAIIFLSDGEPSDRPNDILATIHNSNRHMHNSVVLLCYALGAESYGGFLQKMYRQQYSKGNRNCQNMEYDITKTCNASPTNFCALPQPRVGVYEHMIDSKYLRAAMGSYYSYFAHSNSYSAYQSIGQTSSNRWTSESLGLFNATWSVPYFDAFGRGMVVTAASPLVIGDTLIGVVGVDLTMDELMSDVTYFHSDGFSTYAFIIDKTGRVLIHPYMPTPTAIKDKSILTTVEAFERSEQVQHFLYYKVMNAKHEHGKYEVDTRTISTYKVFPHGHRSVTTVQTDLTYNCVNLETVIVCVVVQQEFDVMPKLQPPNPSTNYTVLYHRLDLYDAGNECKFDNQHSIGDRSVVMFAPMCYEDPQEYLSTKETEESVESLMQYLTSPYNVTLDPNNVQLKQGVKDMVLLTNVLDGFWKNFKDTQGFVIWRYFASTDGVFRISPGIQLPKNYNPVHRPWYKQAKAVLYDHMFRLNCGKEYGCVNVTAISPPYIDAAGTGIVLTISQAITATNGTQQSMIGVIGSDVRVDYVHKIIQNNIPECENEYSWTECILIDTAGYVIFDTELLNRPDVVRNGEYHIIRSRPSMARELIEYNIMQRKQCVDIANVLYHDEYQIDLKTLNNSFDQLTFSAKYVPNTNMVLIVAKRTRQNYKDCHMHDSYMDSCLISPFTKCEHPCANYTTDQHYEMCSNAYNYTWQDDPPPCLPDKYLEEIQFDEVVLKNEQQQDYFNLPDCF